MVPFRLLFEGEAYTYEEYLEYYGDERVASHLWSRRMLGLPLPGDVPQLANDGEPELIAGGLGLRDRGPEQQGQEHHCFRSSRPESSTLAVIPATTSNPTPPRV